MSLHKHHGVLVIFMVTLPLNQRGLDIAVPPETTPSTSAPDRHIVLEYTSDKQHSINKQDVSLPIWVSGCAISTKIAWTRRCS